MGLLMGIVTLASTNEHGIDTLGVASLAMGLLALCGAYFDWEWFMNHRKARFFTTLLGRKGARIFYGLLGVGLLIFGGFYAVGFMPAGR